MFKIIFKIISIIILFNFFFINFTNATDVAPTSLWDNQKEKLKTGGIDETFGETGEPKTPQETVILIVNLLLTFLGIIAVSIILWAGFIWMTSQGEQDKINEAKQWIIRAIIGLIIILSSSVIIHYVIYVTNDDYTTNNPTLTYP